MNRKHQSKRSLYRVNDVLYIIDTKHESERGYYVSYAIDRKHKPKRGLHTIIHVSYRISPVKLDLVQHNDSLLVRQFSSTPPRRGDPLGVVAAAVSSPYTLSFLNNPLGGLVMVSIGLATTLFCVFMSLSSVFGQDNAFSFFLQRLDSILLLCERFLLHERNLVSLIGAHLSSFSSATLHSFYLPLQELVFIHESLFSIMNDLLISPHIQHLPGPLVDRFNQTFENLRLEGNGLMMLVREIEDRLDIAESDRIPSF